jgi:hypothetical protein
MSIDDHIAQAKTLVNNLQRATRDEELALKRLQEAQEDYIVAQARLAITDGHFYNTIDSEDYRDATEVLLVRTLKNLRR